MIGYKLSALERRAPGHAPEHAHSLEHHFGAFMRTLTKRYTERFFSWIKTVCLPALAHALENIIMVIIRVAKYIGAQLSHRMDSFGNKNVPRNGASSFFLKDITEHKKNLKKDEHF